MARTPPLNASDDLARAPSPLGLPRAASDAAPRNGAQGDFQGNDDPLNLGDHRIDQEPERHLPLRRTEFQNPFGRR